jgi:hypothetical protein
MIQESFQRQIFSQIGMADLANALIGFETSRENATTLMVYCLGSAILDTAEDANALMLMSRLLDNAKIPRELLDLLKNHGAVEKEISEETWDFFYGYSFTNRIQTTFTVPDLMDPSAKALMLISVENVIIDILTKPLNMLMGFIEHMASFWKRDLEVVRLTYFLPKHHSELFLHIEAHIAAYYGVQKPFDTGVITDTSNVFFGYRFVGIIDKYPFNKTFHEMSVQAALHQAQSTMQ